MRYRVEVADRPDALYAVWNGRVFRAQRSTADGTVLLVPLPGEEETPEGFDTEWNGHPAKVVPEGETGSTFSIHTLCLFDDEIYRILPQSTDGELTLKWTGQDERVAAELGLVDFTTKTSDPESITALWQERHDLGPADARPGDARADPSALLRAIGRTLVHEMPEGWQRVGAQFRQVGDYAELEVRAVAEDMTVSLSAPPELGQLFARLRAAMYDPATGTWLQGTFTLDAASNFDFDYETDTEPNWRLTPEGRPGARSYDAELEYFPRERKNVPQWLAAKAGLPLEVTFRQARVVDGHNPGEQPVVNRPPVPAEEARAVLGYLYRAPIVLTRPATGPDLFAPNGPADVPDAFHTDGVWIWPAAVPHYLRKYGVPPDPELLDHIRAQNHRTPYVPERVRTTAEAEILGQPHPPQQAADLIEYDQFGRIERGAEPKDLRASEVLSLLRTRLAEHGIPDTAYRIGTPAEGAWCLRRTDQGWEVARHAEGGPTEPLLEAQYFPEIEPAARALLGSLLLYPGRGAVPADQEAAEPAAQAPDWPILPMRGEPPLTFFRAKRMVVLPAGTRVLRFGNEGGNLVHAESTRFPETSLGQQREFERGTYLLRRPLRVLTGVTLPWAGLPGGAIAYLLPRALGQHLETGAIERDPGHQGDRR
ncbi:TNT domain-containing protein [Amycolatopsis cihanbeyliensis]|uniref:Uncharacterized protein DUF4237 n=1 Tax=Amycolatopsis cihanbeyliensis TaxID=1128664 RepID=A0A542DL70_AMYCI|nr:TNT domain-containing protein [Amycolatopsis cihanbeyliensis]TQJ03837.1 uncharacterized protein DUF4237 [Amycolatopsis cihanbeyliensis]